MFFAINVTKCFRCQRIFGAHLKQQLKNVILKKLDYRQHVDSDEKRKKSRVLQNSCYHMNLDWARIIYPFTELSDIVKHGEIRVHLEPEHSDYLAPFELQLR